MTGKEKLLKIIKEANIEDILEIMNTFDICPLSIGLDDKNKYSCEDCEECRKYSLTKEYK